MHEVQTFMIPEHEKELTVAQFWEELHYNPDEFKKYRLNSRLRPKHHLKDYMNDISNEVLKSSPDLDGHRLIYFHDTSNVAPLDHPTGTTCKPDLSLYPDTKERIHWTEIDTTVEIYPAGTNKTDGLRQAISYTLYLLQARPDRVSVQGFYADANSVILIISSADSVKKSPRLTLKDTTHSQLIHAFIKRLYDPHPSMMDPTAKRRKDPTRTQKSLADIMKYTSKVALLALALFGTFALAALYAPINMESELQVHGIDDELFARESFDPYLGSRDDLFLDARDFEARDFEALDLDEYLEYLEAREPATAGHSVPNPPAHSSSKMSQIVIDTETTGREVEHGHHAIEIGAIVSPDRLLHGSHFHTYLNPQRPNNPPRHR